MAAPPAGRSPDIPIRVGISSCLLGEEVRYDALINHSVARFDVAYVRDQIYLRPHPKELMLRNHV